MYDLTPYLIFGGRFQEENLQIIDSLRQHAPAVLLEVELNIIKKKPRGTRKMALVEEV